MSYPSDVLYEEVAFIAFHFHWTQEEILTLDHQTRQRWVNEISKINQQLNGTAYATANGLVQPINSRS